MAVIGVPYSASDIKNIIDPADLIEDYRVVGLFFVKNDDISKPYKFDVLYQQINDDGPSRPFVYPHDNVVTPTQIFHEIQNDNGEIMKMNFNPSDDSRIGLEFSNDQSMDFCFFSTLDLMQLIRLTGLGNNIYFSGLQINVGTSINASSDVNGVNMGPLYSSLKAEVIPDGVSIIHQSVSTIAIGLPCPPYWYRNFRMPNPNHTREEIEKWEKARLAQDLEFNKEYIENAISGNQRNLETYFNKVRNEFQLFSERV